MVEYLGTAYAGFQRQQERMTVQGTLERAITTITGEAVTTVGSGRTDAGAHALGQVVAFSTTSSLPTDRWARALNAVLPRDIAVRDVREVPGDFHPRFSAERRAYRYLIWNRPERSPFWEGRAAHVARTLDTGAMNAAAAALVGVRDMGAFVPTALPGNRVRRIDHAAVSRDGHLLALDLEGAGFLKQMVRAVVGTLILVGRGQMSASRFAAIVLSRDRSQAGPTAPAFGLYLRQVTYPWLEMSLGEPERETQ